MVFQNFKEILEALKKEILKQFLKFFFDYHVKQTVNLIIKIF